MTVRRPRGGLLSRIAGRLMGRKRPPPPPRPPVGAEFTGGGPAPDDFRLAIEQILREEPGRFGIRTHVVSLVEFREAVGTRWPRLADKVMLIAEGVINLHLGSGNLYSRQGPDFFLLLFRNLPQAEARRRALAIAQDLGTRLVGDQFRGVDIPLALAAEIPLEDVFLADGGLNLAAVNGAVSQVRAIVAAAPPPSVTSAPAKAAQALVPAPIATIPHELEGVPPDDPRWREFYRKRKAAADPVWTVMESRPRPDRDHSAPVGADTRMALVWRPSWVAAGETIGAYKAQVQRTDAGMRTPLEGAHAYGGDRDSILALDGFAIAAAARDLSASEKAADGSTVILPIHWQTLSAANRMELVAPFASVAKPVRDVRMVIDLFGLPDQADPAQLADVVAACRSFCRDVMLRTRPGPLCPELALRCGVTVVGLDLAELPPGQHDDDERLLVRLGDYLTAARDAGLGAYVWGLRRRRALIGAVQAGFALVNGPALMKDLPRPAKVLPAPKARFSGSGG